MSNHMIINVIDSGNGYVVMTVEDRYAKTFFTFESMQEIVDRFPTENELLKFICNESEYACAWDYWFDEGGEIQIDCVSSIEFPDFMHE